MLKLEARQCLTTAPEEYDYRWAKTLILNVATDSRGRSLRLVENEDDWHFKQQMMRYGSGLHLTIDRQSVLDEQLEYGLLKLTESPIRIHRRSFDFSSAARTGHNTDSTNSLRLSKPFEQSKASPSTRATVVSPIRWRFVATTNCLSRSSKVSPNLRHP